jgi:hypothetical protein
MMRRPALGHLEPFDQPLRTAAFAGLRARVTREGIVRTWPKAEAVCGQPRRLKMCFFYIQNRRQQKAAKCPFRSFPGRATARRTPPKPTLTSTTTAPKTSQKPK